MLKANHTHDCDSCTLIGTYTWNGQPRDLYVHGKDGDRTVIIREGSDGPEYRSFPEHVIYSFKGEWEFVVHFVRHYRNHEIKAI